MWECRVQRVKSYYVIIDLFGVDSTQTSVRCICTIVG